MQTSEFARVLGQPRRLVQNWGDSGVLEETVVRYRDVRARALFNETEFMIALALVPLGIAGLQVGPLALVAQAIRDVGGEEGFGVNLRRAFDAGKADRPAWLAVFFSRNRAGEQSPHPRGATTEKELSKLIKDLPDEDTPLVVVDLRRALKRWRELDALENDDDE